LGAIKKKNKFNLATILGMQIPLVSNLISDNNQKSSNRFNYVQQSIFLSTNYHFNKGK
jgi:hypothetical protein